MIYSLSRFIFWSILKLFFGFKVYGRENLPKEGGFVLACNHLSYIDPAVLGGGCPRKVKFMARDTLWNNPVLGWWLNAVGVIPVSRRAADFSALRSAIKEAHKGNVVAIFPEGARQVAGKGLGKAQEGIGFLVAKSGVPVIPAFLSGTEKALPKSAKRLRLAKVSICYGKEIHAERRMPYQEIANLVMANIKQLSDKA